jgi:hypothetical protein
MVLFAVLAVLSGLAAIGATMFIITTTDIRIAGNHKQEVESFYQADAGIQYAKSRIEALLAAGSISLSTPAEAVTITPPTGYNFDPLSNLVRQVDLAANDIYMMAVTGRATNSSTRIEATFRRRPAFRMGVFADGSVDMKEGGSIYSYDGEVTQNPTPAGSTGEADSGSNGIITTHVGTFLDGNLLLGADAFGATAEWAEPGGGSTITGEEGLQIGRVEPDPLGALGGGSLAAKFLAVKASNMNSTVGIASTGGTLSGSKTLSSGDYYISNIILGNGDALSINATSGPVSIYLYSSGAECKNGSTINVTGKAADFRIYSNNGSTINLKHGSDFRGFIYAPFADVIVYNSGNFYGAVWSHDLEIKNSGDFFVDVSILKKFLSNKIQMLTWKEVR